MLCGRFSKKGHAPAWLLGRLDFRPGLCHECNGATPAYLYCSAMYGSPFKQNYGWYMSKLALEYGIWEGSVYLPELCPPEVLALVKIPIVVDGVINRDYRDPGNRHQARRQRDAIQRAIENIVRRRYDHKQIGDAWTSETILYHIICALFPTATVMRHYKPKLLRGLELDVYLPELRLGIEYQGIQHFEPIEHWGGPKALERLQERDARKRRLCAPTR